MYKVKKRSDNSHWSVVNGTKHKLIKNFKMIVVKSAFSFKKTLILISMMCVLFLSLISLKDSVPAQWKDTDVVHIVKFLLDWQYFPLDSIPLKPVNSSIRVSDSFLSNAIMKTLGRNSNFYVYRIQNNLQVMQDMDKRKEMEVFLDFQPLLTDNERTISLYIFFIFLEICEKHKFEYFVLEGTLLGTYRHFGFIPWDDDIDVILNAANWSQIRDAFSGNDQIGLYTNSRFQWKIFLKNGFQFDKSKGYRYPFIDIFFYNKDETHLWGVTPSLKPKFIFLVKDIFPLIRRPFENIEVNVPKNIKKILDLSYDTSICQSPNSIHKRDLKVPKNMIKSIPCKFLYNLYPFVFRRQDEHTGQIIEELKIANRITDQRVYSIF